MRDDGQGFGYRRCRCKCSAALFWGSHRLPQSRCFRCLAAVGVRKMPQARGTRERFYHPLFLVFALQAHSLCQSVCEIHGGDKSSGRSGASYGGANGKIRARASQFALRADPLFVRVVSRLLCTHIVLSVEHGKMFETCFEDRNITCHDHREHMTYQT